jgi:hypothetical protein
MDRSRLYWSEEFEEHEQHEELDSKDDNYYDTENDDDEDRAIAPDRERRRALRTSEA